MVRIWIERLPGIARSPVGEDEPTTRDACARHRQTAVGRNQFQVQHWGSSYEAESNSTYAARVDVFAVVDHRSSARGMALSSDVFGRGRQRRRTLQFTYGLPTHPANRRDGCGSGRRHQETDVDDSSARATGKSISKCDLGYRHRAALLRFRTSRLGPELQSRLVPRHTVGGRPCVVADRPRKRTLGAGRIPNATTAVTTYAEIAREHRTVRRSPLCRSRSGVGGLPRTWSRAHPPWTHCRRCRAPR